MNKNLDPTPGSIRIVGPHKGYIGTVEIDFESDTLHGSVIGVRDVITYEGNSPTQLEEAFKDSLDDYLAFCEEQGDIPEKPYSGKFNLRISPELHKELAYEAATKGKSLNSYIKEVLQAHRSLYHVNPSLMEATK